VIDAKERNVMMRKTRFTLRVLTPLSLGMFVPSTVFAQHGPGRHQPASDQRQQGAGPEYDMRSEGTFKGTVEWRAGVQETHLLLKTDTGTVEINLGPTAFLTETKVDIRKGDTLEVTGSRITIGDSQVILAREIRRGDNAWTLRDATGQPLWTSERSQERGFWTTKRVLLAGLLVKAVIVGVVLLK
jgi:hypothetical protein